MVLFCCSNDQTHYKHTPHTAHVARGAAWAGARITGVDDSTYSSTGESFSTIILPQAESTTTKDLQADDVSLGAPTHRHIPLIQF